MTPAEFLEKFTPTENNKLCVCAGEFKCIYCESTELVEKLEDDSKYLRGDYRYVMRNNELLKQEIRELLQHITYLENC